jgi:hypothetical protein
VSSSVFNSLADAQNSVSSKPLVCWGCISNRWKAETVLQRFGIQLRGRIPSKQPQNLFSFQHCNLSRVAVFSKPIFVQKVIEPEPLIGWRQVNTRWKAVGVLYLFGIWLSAKFQIEQHQIWCYWMLLTVRADLTLTPEVSVWMWDGAWLLPAVLLESIRLFIILVPGIKSFSPIKFPIKILSKFALYGRFLFPLNLESS